MKLADFSVMPDFDYTNCKSESNCSKELLKSVKTPYLRIHVFCPINVCFKITQNQ